MKCLRCDNEFISEGHETLFDVVNVVTCPKCVFTQPYLKTDYKDIRDLSQKICQLVYSVCYDSDKNDRSMWREVEDKVADMIMNTVYKSSSLPRGTTERGGMS